MTISPADLLNPTLLKNHCSFADFNGTSLQGIYENCKQTVDLIKSTYNSILLANFHKYNMHKDNKNSPKLEKFNVIMFKKDSSYYYGIVVDIYKDQIEILSSGVSYVRPITEVVHITNLTVAQ